VPTEHFRSPEAYRRYRAYTHIHGIPTHAKRACVKGRGCHTVKHGKQRTRKRGAAKR
jgi:hypothetical protein